MASTRGQANHRPRASGICSPSLAIVAALALFSACHGPPEICLVVESAESWGAAARGGLRAGDRVSAWRGEGVLGGGLDSPLRLQAVEIENAPRGPVTLTVSRLGGWSKAEELEIELPPGRWALETRPALRGRHKRRYLEATHLEKEEEPAAALRLWERLAEDAAADGRPLDAAYFHLRRARSLGAMQRPEEARRVFADARQGLDPELAAIVFDHEGAWLKEIWQLQEAEATYERALLLRQKDGPDSLPVAWTLARLGSVAFPQRRLERRSDVERALGIYRRCERGSSEVADTLRVLGGFAWAASDLDGAESHYREALDTLEAAGSRGPVRAGLLDNLGLIAHFAGDLDRAESFALRALAAYQQLGIVGSGLDQVLNNLGIIHLEKGDLAAAQSWLEKALAVARQVSPESTAVAGLLNNLGVITSRRGDTRAALRYYEQALELREDLDPDSFEVAESLHNLGTIHLRQGERERARPLFERALARMEALLPESLWTATTLAFLAETETDLEKAETLHMRALTLRRQLGPERPQVADSLFALGGLAYRRGRLEEAEARWREAIQSHEARRHRLGFTADELSRLSAPFQHYYRTLAELLVDQGRVREAFEVLESARARALRSLVARRGLRSAALVPRMLSSESLRLEREIARTLSTLYRMSAEAEGLGEVQARLAGLRERWGQVQERLRQVVPGLALLYEPTVVGLDEVRSALEPDTVLLSFSVGPERTLIFAIGGGGEPGIEVWSSPAGAEELAERVDRFRAFVDRGRRVTAPDPALIFQARRLYEMLLAPAAERIAAAERLLLIPEGPLLTLPFAALVAPGEPAAFLAEGRSILVEASAGVVVEALRQPAARSPSPSLLVLAAPATDPAGDLPPLPGSLREAEGIGGLFEDAEILTGAEATEAALRELSAERTHLHIATHALLDRRIPLESAVVLGGGVESPADDGLLHAWEVAGSLTFDLELVVLSACDTGLGAERAGEGIVGLARAFQAAGASSLVASLWAVDDRSSAELMMRFYRHLRTGSPKDGALRRAQAELIEAPVETSGGELRDYRHPFHWAGFQLRGDWR